MIVFSFFFLSTLIVKIHYDFFKICKIGGVDEIVSFKLKKHQGRRDKEKIFQSSRESFDFILHSVINISLLPLQLCIVIKKNTIDNPNSQTKSSTEHVQISRGCLPAQRLH